ncbi:MAG: MlaD family protein [Thermodesulfobacteriota bacterium]
MSVRTNKAVIGLFVLGAICLAVVGVVLFGSGKFFAPTSKYVMYFDGSIKGLSVGAPVVFRGVRIGSVSDIILQGNMRDMTFTVPVIVEIDLDRFRINNGKPAAADYHQALIGRGMRAQLQAQSLVTGQLMINLDFYPGRPARLLPDSTGLPQVPTIPSTAAELAQKFEELPLQQMAQRANAVLGGLEKLVNSAEVQNGPRELNQAAADARRLIARIDREVGLLGDEARGAIGAATAAITRLDRLLAFEEGPPAELAGNLNLTLAEVRTSLDHFNQTLDAIRETATDERSQYQLRQALRELSETSRALNALIDALDRNPESLLRGKTAVEKN